MAIARRRVARHLRRLVQRHGDREFVVAAHLGHHRSHAARFRFPAHVAPLGPHHAHPPELGAYRVGRELREALHIALQRRIFLRRREHQMQHVADAQPFHRHRRGQHAVQHALLELLLAPQYREPLTALEQVDPLGATHDFRFVDDQVALVRLPRQRNRTERIEHLRRGDARCRLGIDRHLAILQPLLAVENQEDRRIVLDLARIDRRRGLHPIRCRRIKRLVTGMHNTGRRHQGEEERTPKHEFTPEIWRSV